MNQLVGQSGSAGRRIKAHNPSRHGCRGSLEGIERVIDGQVRKLYLALLYPIVFFLLTQLSKLAAGVEDDLVFGTLENPP